MKAQNDKLREQAGVSDQTLELQHQADQLKSDLAQEEKKLK